MPLLKLKIQFELHSDCVIRANLFSHLLKKICFFSIYHLVLL